MTAPATVEPAPWPPTVPKPVRGVGSRLLAAGLHATAGLLLAAIVLGLAVASSIIERGYVVAEPSDVATLRALSPLFALFAVVAIGHVVAAVGMVLGSRSAAGLGIGLGAFDLVAGIVVLIAAAISEPGQFDGVGFGMTLVLSGIVLAVVARAAEWNAGEAAATPA